MLKAIPLRQISTLSYTIYAMTSLTNTDSWLSWTDCKVIHIVLAQTIHMTMAGGVFV